LAGVDALACGRVTGWVVVEIKPVPHRATVEAKLSGEHGWRELLVFDLHTEKVDRPQYITYNNDPEWEA
jgi:hypothetical protein